MRQTRLDPHPHEPVAFLHVKGLLEGHHECPVHVADGVKLQVELHFFCRLIQRDQVVLQRHNTTLKKHMQSSKKRKKAISAHFWLTTYTSPF